MNWTARDTLGCLIVPASSAALCSAGSSLDALRGAMPLDLALSGRADPSNLRLFLVLFSLSIAVQFLIYLTSRLTFIQNLASVRHRRMLYLTMVTSVIVIAASVFSILLNTALLGAGVDLASWSGFVERALKGHSGDTILLALIVFGLLGQGLITGYIAARWFAPAISPVQNARQSNQRTIAGLAIIAAIVIATFVPLSIKWRIESQRAGCIMNIRNVQQANRSYHGMNAQPIVFRRDIVGPGNFVEKLPVCPGGGHYRWNEGKELPIGELMLRCSNPDHIPPNHEDW
jgi:hypothetical protein